MLIFMRRPSLTLIVLGAISLSALLALPAAAGDATNPYPGYHSEVYSDPANWVCRPDTDDACDHDFDATIIEPHRHTRLNDWRAAREPAIDCFYVYPTISTDDSGNSDLIPGDDQEIFVTRQQAARLGAVCRMFAPVYRQVTLTALISILQGNPIPSDSELADATLLDAWKHYIANDSDGRGFILIGHSQGADRLVTLIRNEIDSRPELRDRLVSAILLGTSFQIPEDADVGGDFANIPLCHSKDDIGCVITYATFRATAPPPGNSFFGRSRGPGLKAACTNPASLGGGSGVLMPYLPTDGKSLPIIPVNNPPDWVDPAEGATINTPFVTLPHLLSARCAERDGFTYLELTVHGDPADPRIDNIGGDLTPEWGLHLVDANIAMGNFVTLARSQARAYRRAHR
jgi:hypothetical protein